MGRDDIVGEPLRRLPKHGRRQSAAPTSGDRTGIAAGEWPRRKRIRMALDAYEPHGAVFSVTICANRRRAVFANERWAQPVFDSILKGPLSTEADLLAVCLMPTHLHVVLVPTCANLVSLVNRWKVFTTNLLHRLAFTGPLWQRSFYDHALRGGEAPAAVANYVINNPVRSGLVVEWWQYPYVWTK